MRTVAIVSGGLDSVTLAHFLVDRGDRLDIVSFDYGQKHRRELGFAEATARRLGVVWICIDLHAAGIGAILGGSALTDAEISVPDGHYAAETMSVTIVPNRNAVMLCIAAAAATARGADAVALAVHGGDHFIYPDCRPEFVVAFQTMQRLAMDAPDFIVDAPFIRKTKADIVRIGRDLGVPFDQTWSCYKGGALHCGTCGTCVERREAFELAEVNDPTDYLTSPQPTTDLHA